MNVIPMPVEKAREKNDFPASAFGYVAFRAPAAIDPRYPDFTHMYSTPWRDLDEIERTFEHTITNERVGDFWVARFDLAHVERWTL